MTSSSHRSSYRMRGLAAASVTTLALLGLSACGGDDSDAKASDSTASSASATTSTDSSGGSTSGKPAAGSEVSAADMAALFKTAFDNADSAHVSLKTEGGSMAITAEGDAKFGDDMAVQMTMNLPSMGQAEVRLVDKTVYMKLPMLGDKFIKFDLDDPSNPLGSTFTDQLDPSKLVTSLEGAIDKATYVGAETVDGQPVDHYTAQVDTQKMLANSSLPKSATSGSGLPATIPYDMYFDSQGRISQIKAELGSLGGTFVVTFSNWGEDVDVQAPPASQTTDMPSLPTLPSDGASS